MADEPGPAQPGAAPQHGVPQGGVPQGGVPQGAAQRAARAAIAAVALQPPLPGRRRERRQVKGIAALALVVLAVLALAGYEFAANAGHVRSATAAAHPGARHPVVRASASSPATVSTAPASPSPATSVSASSPPRVLTPARVTAFGPGGPADGENPHNAALAVSGHPATPWYSYVSASWGLPGPASGTGLLLDMGRTVTVTSVQVSMDGPRGATLQLRAGDKPLLSSLPEVATVSGAGGTVLLQPASTVKVRYLLVWFTQLPPDTLGTYQANVYRIVVQGQS